ncbi:MAG: hypothetical protein A3F72_15305 [Bacteroidetes bacterium RIFCSPLOWO2_12_FULL_35_15]|nr:MAG: hypothetical protein A3F72_15305 [Bacteroidetes bacterium RIFCSPLOWO2_12_FULL_35_15]
MKKRFHIQRIIGLHRERVARLFQLYGIDLPITIQNVWDALYLKGGEFSDSFWNIGNVNFSGDLDKTKTSFFSKPEVIKDNTPFLVMGIALIIVLVVIVFVTRKKNVG